MLWCCLARESFLQCNSRLIVAISEAHWAWPRPRPSLEDGLKIAILLFLTEGSEFSVFVEFIFRLWNLRSKQYTPCTFSFTISKYQAPKISSLTICKFSIVQPFMLELIFTPGIMWELSFTRVPAYVSVVPSASSQLKNTPVEASLQEGQEEDCRLER